MNYALHRYVRIGEIVVVVVLSIFALMTWLELNALRKAPVVLPNYQFESLSTAEGTPMVVTRGTWIAENGPPEPLLTTTIECRKDRMECVERQRGGDEGMDRPVRDAKAPAEPRRQARAQQGIGERRPGEVPGAAGPDPGAGHRVQGPGGHE
jgi:hypothetical protein